MFICAIIISVYVARFFGPEAKGAYSLLIQTISISVLLGMCGIDNAIVYSLSKNESLKKVYPNIISFTLISGVSITLLLFFSSRFLKSTLLRNIDTSLIEISILTIPFMLFNKLSITAILGLNKIKQFNTFKIASAIVTLISFFILVIIFKWGIKGAISSILFTEVFMSLWYVYVISKKVKIKINFDINFIQKLFNYGIRGFLGPLLLMAIFKIDYYILNMFSNIRDVGFYSVSVGFGEMLFFIPEAIGVVLFPKLASMSHIDSNKKTVQLLRFFFLMMSIITLLLFLFSREIMVFIYGIQYASSAYLMRIMLPGFFFLSFYYLYFSYFYSRGKPEVVTVILFVTTIIKTLLSLVLIPKFGVQGASFGTLISYLICGFIFVLTFLRYSGENLKSIFFITSLDIRYILSHMPIKRLRDRNACDIMKMRE